MIQSRRLSRIPVYLFSQIAELKRQLRQEGVDIIDLGIGDPDRPTPRHIIEALKEAVEDPQTHRYDESGFGDLELRRAFCEWFEKRFGVRLDPERNIQVLIGSKEGLAHLIWTYVEPGDVVLVPDPAYPVYRNNTLLAGGEPYYMPLLKENKFLPDLSAIPEKVAKKAKLLFLNYPNNPTAAVADLDFFREVVEFAHKYEILVAHDAAYSEVTFDGYVAPSLLQVEGAFDVVVEFHTLSKTFNMTGWRLGFAVGNEQAIKDLSKLKSHVDSSVFLAIQRAGIAAYCGPWEPVKETMEAYRRRRDVLVEGLQRLGCPVEKPKGTFYVWIPVPEGETSESFSEKLLRKAGVLTIPGTGYGKHGEGFVRASLTLLDPNPEARLQEAVERMERAGVRW